MFAIHTLAELSSLAGALPSMDGFFAELTTWLLRVITVGGGFFLLIDMAKHLFSSPRDLRSAGIDLAVFVILLALAGQAPTIASKAAELIK
ncbi:MAG: hypothetical protein DIU80_003445 [Chloroflexota bacterium]